MKRSKNLSPSAKVLVCDNCLRASCWYGEFRCERYIPAGLKILTVSQLRKLQYEHEDFWTDEKMIEIYGDANREFRV
jgi:hypothetical protein